MIVQARLIMEIIKIYCYVQDKPLKVVNVNMILDTMFTVPNDIINTEQRKQVLLDHD
jgi:hypothetical protein